jgi:hypothetical protein
MLQLTTFTATMLKLIISILSILISGVVFSQDTLKRQEFVRLHLELSSIPTYIIHEIPRYDISFAVDAEYKAKYFPIIEGGWNKIVDNKNDYQYNSQGIFGRIGINQNLIKPQSVTDRNTFYVGARYCFANYQQQISNIRIEGDWGTATGNYKYNGLSAQWVELVFGMQGEIAKNLFLGYTIRMKRKVAFDDYGSFAPYMIPGYGKGNRDLDFGFNYYVSYAIPVKKLFPVPNPERKPLFKKKKKEAFKQKKNDKVKAGSYIQNKRYRPEKE